MTTAKSKEALVKWCLDNPDWLFVEFGYAPDDSDIKGASDIEVLEFAQAQEICCKPSSWARFSKENVNESPPPVGSYQMAHSSAWLISNPRPHKGAVVDATVRKIASRAFGIKAAIADNAESELLTNIRGFVDEYEDGTFIARCETD